jgi:hypothetical protein
MKVCQLHPLAALASAMALMACSVPSMTDSREVNLRDFSDSNYVSLERALGRPVCVTGRLSIDTAGIYFALQPTERDGAIDVGFSRINTDLSYRSADLSGIKHAEVHTLCGTLEIATPFEVCDVNECKWYRLKEAKLRK